MDVTREQEERYLQMLRRVALGLAKTLLVLVALALFVAAYQGASGVYHWTDSRRSHLPSQTERLQAVDPCSYFTNTADASNGKDQQGDIPVNQILKSCKVEKTPDATFKTSADAIAASRTDIMATMTENLSRVYNNESQARSQILKQHENDAETAARHVRDSELYSDAEKKTLDLEVSTAIAAYYAMIRGTLKREQLAVAEDAAVAHALDSRFVVNQIAVPLQTAVKEKQEALGAMAVAFVSATGLLWNAAQLFGAFLALMFLFLFIKYELHLRDMNNSLSSKSNHA